MFFASGKEKQSNIFSLLWRKPYMVQLLLNYLPEAKKGKANLLNKIAVFDSTYANMAIHKKCYLVLHTEFRMLAATVL